MVMIFYPHEDELTTSTMDQKLEVLLESAERYKVMVLDGGQQELPSANSAEKKRATPRDIRYSFNWEDISRLLRHIREMPEANPSSKLLKAAKLRKLAEVYEVLRAAKMPKLEAVRIALMNESTHLSAGQVT